MVEVLPDLLVHDDGTEVTAATWSRRRRELQDAVLFHEYGGLPPAPAATEALLLGSHSLRSGEVARTVVDRGYLLASFNRTALAADDPDLYRRTGLYRLFPDLDRLLR